MRYHDHGHSIELWLSAANTQAWALGLAGGGCWPNSELKGRTVYANLDSSGLVELRIDGRHLGNRLHIEAAEVSACLADHLAPKLPADHPVWWVAVGQFQAAPEGTE